MIIILTHKNRDTSTPVNTEQQTLTAMYLSNHTVVCFNADSNFPMQIWSLLMASFVGKISR